MGFLNPVIWGFVVVVVAICGVTGWLFWWIAIVNGFFCCDFLERSVGAVDCCGSRMWRPVEDVVSRVFFFFLTSHQTP